MNGIERSTRRAVIVAAMATIALAKGVLAQSPPLQIPFVDDWAGSPHARITDEPFNHWNEEGEIPAACARCHSTPGFRDYIGADGTPPGVDHPAPVGTVIACVACHNEVTIHMDSVTFPSGAEITGVGDDSRCMTCHQGRESTVSVNEALEGHGDDDLSDELHFINIHYRAAGATRYGTEAKGAYEYTGNDYRGYFLHDEDVNRCADCHEQHTVKVRVDECAGCHKSPRIREKEDLRAIRDRSKDDFDGDGDAEEGIAEEIATLQDALYAAIQLYGQEVSGTPVVYDAHNYPYFFNDSNGNGKADPDEASYPNRYSTWTPRLLRAAYNYQYSLKDPGVYAHNPLYVIQTLYDSLADLGTKVQVDMAGMVRPSS
jgi:hypothetical protein